LPEVREEQKNPAVAGPASLPDTGPCGAHGASDDDLEVPHRAPSKSLSITSCKKMPNPLFCPLLDRGEKPGHVIRVVPEVKEEQENAAVAAPASLPSTGPCGAHGASTGRLEYLWGLLESFCFIVSGCVSCHLNLVPAHVELTVPLGD